MRLLALVLLALVACQQTSSPPPLLPNPHDAAQEVLGLERLGREGPYLTGAKERFRLHLAGTTVSGLTWSATDGALSASGTEATWTLPGEGAASLAVRFLDASGVEQRSSWSFQVDSPRSQAARAREALLAAPMPVLDGGTATTGSACDLAYDSSNNVHLVFRDDDHASLYYGKWNGSTWSLEFVDGMGFNNGGQIGTLFTLAVDSAGTPHLAYAYSNPTAQVRYATKSGGAWVRERVDTTTSGFSTRGGVTMALDPSANQAPTIAYDGNNSGYSRVNLARRTAPGTWSIGSMNFASGNTSDYVAGDLLVDAAGVAYLPLGGRLGQHTTSSGSHVALPRYISWAEVIFAGAANRILVRSDAEVIDIGVATPFTSSTRVLSQIEISNTNTGDIAWQQKPYVLHNHGGHLELVTTDGSNFWTYAQLGAVTTSSRVALAVSSSGTASICYQHNGRVMFQ